MKKLYTYLTMALMAMTTVTVLTGCEDSDAAEARTLDGSWTGYIETTYYDRWGLTGSQYRTTMFFNQQNRYGGTGYEVDYNLNSRYTDYAYSEFYWEVDRGEIRIRYADSWSDVYIYDYRLFSDYFEGYMDDGTRRDIYFRLNYDGRFDWSYYRSNYYYDGYGLYAPTRGTDAATIRGEGYCASGEFARARNK